MIDQRVQKTRKALHVSLIALIQEKGYDSVTVKDIVEHADVGRSTFYSHYLDKEHLLQGGLDDFGKHLLAQQKALHSMGRDGPGLSFSKAFFQHAHGYRTVYRAMLGNHAGTVIAERMRRLLAQLVSYDLAARRISGQVEDVPRPAQVAFTVGAIMSLLTWWVDAEQDYGADDLDALFRRMAAPMIG